MAMVTVVYWLPTGGLLARVYWLGPKGRQPLALFLQLPRELAQCSRYDSTINIVQVYYCYIQCETVVLRRKLRH